MEIAFNRKETIAICWRNTSMKTVIRSPRREDIAEYPPEVVREAAINAILHSDYSTMRSCIQVAIFDDRMEITNPGPLPPEIGCKRSLASDLLKMQASSEGIVPSIDISCHGHNCVQNCTLSSSVC